VLEHSGSSSIVGETELLKEKFPAAYDDLYVRNAADISNIPEKVKMAGKLKACSTVSSHTYAVDTVYDATALIREIAAQREIKGASALEMECLSPAGKTCVPLQTAEDVVKRVRDERAAARQRELDRQTELLQQEHLTRRGEPHGNGEGAEGVYCFDTEHLDRLNPLFRRWYTDPASRPNKYDDCLMVYTSGTTARPKGAVHTHASVSNMVKVLQEAWEWKDTDSILHVLPVHHIHGLVNILLCSLASNARCVFTKFDDASRVARRIGEGDITLFMAVPTIYTKLISSTAKDLTEGERAYFKKCCLDNVRLMVSGSAALPVPTLNQFRELSGHTLLERYGMTEIGMALSQPLRPVEERHPGTVGSPLPSVVAYVHKPETDEAAEQAESKESQYDEVGSLAIASESLFDRYWNNPAATKKELRTNAAGTRFFDTGDTVGVQRAAGKPAVYTILGRSSVDILKSRGYKLSALEIEAALLAHKDLFYEVAVVGAADEVLGDKVVAVIAMQPEAAKARGIVFSETVRSYESPELTAELKKVALETLAPYKCPSRYIIVPEVPRNPTGKVNKKDLKKALSLP
jgi:acyl-CoA synthetase (AMP-forming)/AMP-acid ligase II